MCDENSPKEQRRQVFKEIRDYTFEEGRRRFALENGSLGQKLYLILDIPSRNKYKKYSYALFHFTAVEKYFRTKNNLGAGSFTREMLDSESYRSLAKGTKYIIQRELKQAEITKPKTIQKKPNTRH